MAQIRKEIRDYLVKLVVEDERKATELGYEHGINPARIRAWVRTYKKNQALISTDKDNLQSSTELKRRIAELEKKEKELEEENNILKKAMHVFAKNHT